MNSKTKFEEGGVNENCIENIEKLPSTILQSLECCICLSLVKNPLECSECQSLYCEDCFNQIKIKGQGCVMRCKNSKITKAGPFIYNILERLKFKCLNCGIGNMPYSIFIIHSDICEIATKYSVVDELKNIIDEKNEDIESLKAKVNSLNNGEVVVEDLDNVPQDLIRKELITNKLTIEDKMKLYQATFDGKLNEFKNLVEVKGYPMLEEVSAKNYYWSPLHYALHYGKMNVAYYILDKLKEQGKYEKALQLESNDGRNPVLCLLKSNALNSTQKKEYFNDLTLKYKLYVNTLTKKEIRNRNLEDIFKTNQKQFMHK